MPAGDMPNSPRQRNGAQTSEISRLPRFSGRLESLKSGENIRKAVLLVVAVLVLATAGFGWWSDRHDNTPDKVFADAIGKLLSTKSITQSVSSNTASLSVKFDMRNVKDPRVSMTIAEQDGATVAKVSGYGSLQNEYLKYTTFGDAALDGSLKSLVNKWVQIRTNGTVAADANADAKALTDPRYLMFGDFLMGNFSAADRQDLLQFIKSNHVYNYDVKHVKTVAVQGRNAYVYSLTENVPELKKLNQKAAAVMGVPLADVEPALAGINEGGAIELYIDEGTKEIVGYVNTVGTTVARGSYTDYDMTSLPPQPHADLTWAQFTHKESALTSQPDGVASL